MTLLIVDDDYALRSAIARWATLKGFETLVAESAEQALMILETHVVDVAVVDVRLPGMDGLTLARQMVRAVPERPIILMTAHADLDSARQSLNAGVYEYFTKPFVFEDLGAGIQRAMQYHQLLLENSHHRALLEKEVARRTEELSQANARLKQEIDMRERLSEKIVQLERLGALAEMSAGVSHNLNNILTGVLGPAQMIEMQTQDAVILKEARIIQEAALRAADVVKRLALAVGGENDVPMPVDVCHIVREAISASRPRWKDEAEANGITIDVVVHEHAIPHVRATPNGLRNVLLNVISNAVDAMTKSGRITLECKQVQDLVQISISDTGIGMDEETCRRIFEPFFTTKAHVGTGLGMATVFTSISRWGGHIEVKSTPGKGTSVVMALPVWKTDLTTLQTPVHANRSGRVLVIEDEQIVRSFLERILSKHHHVDTALDGFEALALIEKQVYDVALVDLGMPGMPGDQVAQQFREHDAHMAIILITGWDLVENERLKVFDDYLKKPFDTVDKILSAVSRAIHLRDERVQKDTQIE